MLINVDDPVRNAILNVSFVAIVAFAALAVVPWGFLGARGMSRLALWLPLPTFLLAFIYEAAMPSGYDIRLDLFLLLPAYAVVLIATLFRALALRRARRRQIDTHAV